MSFVNHFQQKTPLIDAIRNYVHQSHAPFYAPGHKRGQGISRSLVELLGPDVFAADLPELPDLDNLFAPAGAILAAQNLAAQAFGAEQTWFLVNGSTCGIMAGILGTCGSGDKIILPRNVHRSAIAGLILSGAIPIFITPEYDPDWDLAYSITPTAVSAALERHPDTKAVMMVYPTYHGICGDIQAIAHLCHQHHIPLLVDEAHGPHFAFHPEFPTSALAAGADLTVQSTHKVLGAMTQASMLHVQGQRIDRERLSQALQLLQSTSPSYLLMASLDSARQQMALEGKQLMQQTLKLADEARSRLSEIPGICVLEPPGTQITPDDACDPFLLHPPAHSPGFVALDRTRLTVKVSNLGITGFEADEILANMGVLAELPALQHLTFIISLGNTAADIDKLCQGFHTLAQTNPNGEAIAHWETVFSQWKQEFLQIHPSSFIRQPTLSPREAFFRATETLPAEQACDSVSGELVCPYPPGIPVLMPGEAITPAALEYLQQVLALGGTITGCSDPSLKTLKVVRQLIVNC